MDESLAKAAYKRGYYSYPAWDQNPYKRGSVEAFMWNLGHHEAWCGIGVSV